MLTNIDMDDHERCDGSEKGDNGINEIVRSTYGEENGKLVKSGNNKDGKKDYLVYYGGKENSPTMESEESSDGEFVNQNYEMNSTEEMLEKNIKEFRRVEKEEKMRTREDIMREFLGGSPRLVENGIGRASESGSMGYSPKIEHVGGTKRRCREFGKGSSENGSASEEIDTSPISLERIEEMGEVRESLKDKGEGIGESEIESPAIVPFGRLKKVDEFDQERKEGKNLSKSQKKKIAKRAKGRSLSLSPHN